MESERQTFHASSNLSELADATAPTRDGQTREFTANEVRALLRAACDNAGGQNAWARAHGVSNAYVSDVLLGRREPGPAICGALALTVITRYERTSRRRSGEKECQ